MAPATAMRGPLGVPEPPTTAGRTATALDRSAPPTSARFAAPLLTRSGRNWVSAGGGGHGSVSGRDSRRSSGSWTMPARSPVGVREATRSSTRFTGGGAPAASRPSHGTFRLSPIRPEDNGGNGAPSSDRTGTAPVRDEAATTP